METSLTKKVSRIYCKLWPRKVNACLKISIYGEVVTVLVRNAFIKIHDVEFENVTIEYLSVQGGIYSTTPAFMNKVGL
jgi:hypothetical protein